MRFIEGVFVLIVHFAVYRSSAFHSEQATTVFLLPQYLHIVGHIYTTSTVPQCCWVCFPSPLSRSQPLQACYHHVQVSKLPFKPPHSNGQSPQEISRAISAATAVPITECSPTATVSPAPCLPRCLRRTKRGSQTSVTGPPRLNRLSQLPNRLAWLW